MDLSKLAIRDLAQAQRAQQLTCSHLVSYHIDRINKYNSKVNALHLINAEQAQALAKVRDSETSAKKISGRLHGICFTAKDSTDVFGLPTGHGSLHGAIKSAEKSSTIVKRLIDEGAICIGKGNMAEYGKSYYTENPVFGRTLNPFNVLHSPGGSSGGDAAALACNFASFSVVADSGGSVRVPANFCGLFGLYPTRGLLSDGEMSSPPLAISSLFRRNGFLTRNLSDIELLLSVTTGYDSKDPYSVAPPPGSIDRRFSRKRFGYFTAMNGVDCDPEIAAALLEKVKQLRALGFEGEEHCPQEFAACFEVFIILAAQASLQLEDLLAQESGNPRNLNAEGSIVRNLRERVAKELPPLTSQAVLRAWSRVDALRFQVQSLWDRFDFMLTPVTATLPPLHETALYTVGKQTLQSQQVFQFASAVNVLGLPAIAFPTGLSKQAMLPIGLQIIGPQFSEYALIDVLRNLGTCTNLNLCNFPS